MTDYQNPIAGEVVLSKRPLEELAVKINAKHDAACKAAQNTFDHYIDAGDYLLEAKSQLSHDGWLIWLARNCPSVTPRQAQKYMSLARNRGAIKCEPGSHLSINNTLKMLSAEPEEEKEEASQEQTESSKQDEPESEKAPSSGHETPAEETREDSTEEPPAEPKVPVDAIGFPLPDKCLPAFEAASELAKICKQIDSISTQVSDLAGKPGARLLHIDSVTQSLKKIRSAIWGARAKHVCPYCQGRKDKCDCCKGEGWVNGDYWKQAPEEKRKVMEAVPF